MKFDNISDAYAIVENYEYGTLKQKIYLEACAYTLKYFREKYGKDSFWFRELFAHMQGDDWENTFKVRSLLHAEVIGCPHNNIIKCDRYKNEAEMEVFKGKICQHCRYVEGIKEEWESK